MKFRDQWLEDYWNGEKADKRIPAEQLPRLTRKLQYLAAAKSLNDLRIPPGNHLEKLTGDLRGYCSIRVNQQWRLVFRWDNKYGARDVYFTDYHR